MNVPPLCLPWLGSWAGQVVFPLSYEYFLSDATSTACHAMNKTFSGSCRGGENGHVLRMARFIVVSQRKDPRTYR